MLTEGDFAELKSFELSHRWMSAAHDRLPDDALATIRPLTREAALRFAEEARKRCVARPMSENDASFAAEWDSESHVRAVLSGLPIEDEAVVLVSWTDELAIVTTWATLQRHWTAFLYPSSDDVSVWAPASTWALCYRHFQFIEYRLRARVA